VPRYLPGVGFRPRLLFACGEGKQKLVAVFHIKSKIQQIDWNLTNTNNMENNVMLSVQPFG
jgi:hypothetical protein